MKILAKFTLKNLRRFLKSSHPASSRQTEFLKSLPFSSSFPIPQRGCTAIQNENQVHEETKLSGQNKTSGKPPMNALQSIKLIKSAEGKHRRTRSRSNSPSDPSIWSTAVRAWVVEFQERDRSEHLPAFDSLFRDALRPSGRGAKSGLS